MARFLTTLKFEDEHGLPFTLLEDLVYVTDVLADERFPLGLPREAEIRVPAGFKTDLASIPQFLWSVLPPVGRYDRAAVVHDYLYRFNGVTRRQADDVLNEAMGALGVRATQRWTIYAGVRTGGWLPWRNYREGRPETV